MSRRMRTSSFVTKLMATPLRPKRPERPILSEDEIGQCEKDGEEKEERGEKKMQTDKGFRNGLLKRATDEQFCSFLSHAYTHTHTHTHTHTPVNVELAVVGKVVVDDERDLLDINTTGPDVRRDEDAAVFCALRRRKLCE
jgi:hypothetical protein